MVGLGTQLRLSQAIGPLCSLLMDRGLLEGHSLLSRRLPAGPVAKEPEVLRMTPSDVVLFLRGGVMEWQGSLNQEWGIATRDEELPPALA